MEIRNFLKGNMYNHKFITKWNIKSEDIVEQLFNYYLKNYDKIKEKHSLNLRKEIFVILLQV